MRRKRKLWEILAPNPSVRYGMAEKLNVGHWMRVETPYGKKLQVYEHGIGKEGGTSILLRHGYTGDMRSVSHDPAEYLVEVSATTSTKKSERVLFAHTDEAIVTIDDNGTVGQYSVEEVFAKIGYSEEWWDEKVVTNVTRNLGIIFILTYPSTYWYIVDKYFNVVLSGVLDGYEVDFYTYYNGKLRVLMYNLDDGSYTWAEWTKDGIHRTGFIGDVDIQNLAGRYYITRDAEYIRFVDYETGDTVSYEALNRWCTIEVKSVDDNQFRVYVAYSYGPPVTLKFRDLLNKLPETGSYLSLEELTSESEAVVYEFYINDRDVRFEGKINGEFYGNVVSRKDTSACGVYGYDGHFCKWVSRGSTPPYYVLTGAWDPVRNYDDGTVLLSLNNIDYTSNFTLPEDEVVIYRKIDSSGYPRKPREYYIRLAVKNKEVWFKGSSANDIIYSVRSISFNPDTGEAYIRLIVLRDTYEDVYFKVTKDRIERVEGYSYYQLVDISERAPVYFEFSPRRYAARCPYTNTFHITLHAYIEDCRDVDPELFSEALSEASYVISFYGGLVGSPYDCICEGYYLGGVEVLLMYSKRAYLLRYVRPGSYTTVSYKEELIPYRAEYMKIALQSTGMESFICYKSIREVAYNNPSLRGIDKDYECSGYNVKIGNYWYPGYLLVRNYPTFVFKAIGDGKYLIYGLRDIVILDSNNTFKNLICNTFSYTFKLMLNKKAVIKADAVRSVVASDGKNVRWIGKLNGIDGEYLNDRLIFNGPVEYMGGGYNFAAISRLEGTEWVTYIADTDTLMAGERGVVLDKVQYFDFYNFDAQDVFVFGTRGVKIRNTR